nr:myoD family inhibitor domain-containing protein isoform X2 [Paramormyrops kingsleyae]
MRKEGWLRMSQETASPLKTGSSVRDGLLLFNEGCGSADRPADSEGRPGTIASAEEFPEPRGHVTTGSSTNGDLVRNQPEPVDLGAGKGVGGVLHGPTTRPKKHPVSHRVQHKLRSVGGDRGHSVDSLPEACCASLVLACLFCRCTELCLHLLGALSGCARPACHSCCLVLCPGAVPSAMNPPRTCTATSTATLSSPAPVTAACNACWHASSASSTECAAPASSSSAAAAAAGVTANPILVTQRMDPIAPAGLAAA